MSRNIRKIYGLAIAVTYAFTVVISTTLYVLTSSSSMARLFPLMYFLGPYAGAALLTLYMNSYFGEEALTAVRIFTIFKLVVLKVKILKISF